MKALAIKQPWATGILLGNKQVENRTWSTNYRGQLLIHVCMQPDESWMGLSALRYQLTYPNDAGLIDVRGVLMGVVEMVDCVPSDECMSHWNNNSGWCWKLSNPKIFTEPIPYRGRQGLFEVDLSTVQTAIKSALNPYAWAAQRGSNFDPYRSCPADKYGRTFD